jgi:hypothetical protein
MGNPFRIAGQTAAQNRAPPARRASRIQVPATDFAFCSIAVSETGTLDATTTEPDTANNEPAAKPGQVAAGSSREAVKPDTAAMLRRIAAASRA